MNIVSYLYSGTKLAECIRSILVVMGIQKIYNIFNMRKLNTHPTENMYRAREFYNANINRIENVRNMLADEKSKTVLTKLIHMRQYYDVKDIPPYNHFDQYFSKDIISFTDDEVFLDCGAFNGYTSIDFIKRCPHYSKIVLFEPQKDIIPDLQNRMKKYKNIFIIPKGCSNRENEAILSLAGESSTVTQTTNADTCEISLTSIDSCPECIDASFIKMDIEGSEYEALNGAKEIIKKNKPKLAISIYHSDEDMLRLAEYIHKLVPEYKLFVRAHRPGIAETVLYAVI